MKMLFRQRLFSWFDSYDIYDESNLPKFEIYMGNTCVGSIKKEFTLFKPSFDIDFKGWHVDGNFLEWDYRIYDRMGHRVATVSKQLFNLTDNLELTKEILKDGIKIYG